MSDRTYANDTLRVLFERGSCRHFKEEPVPEPVLAEVLAAGIQAPSGGNLQPYSIIRVEEPATRRKLAELCEDQEFIAKAPVDLLFCIDLHRLERWAKLESAPFTALNSFRHFWIAFQDTVICAQNVCTAADALGLGSVYVGSVLECFRELKELLGLPDGVFPVVLLSLGIPATPVRVSRRLGPGVVVHRERYRDPGDQELLDAFDEKYRKRQTPLSEERLARFQKVCQNARGEEYAAAAERRARENGYINEAQRYFGLHYEADFMPTGNEEYLRVLRDFGFTCFGAGR